MACSFFLANFDPCPLICYHLRSSAFALHAVAFSFFTDDDLFLLAAEFLAVACHQMPPAVICRPE